MKLSTQYSLYLITEQPCNVCPHTIQFARRDLVVSTCWLDIACVSFIEAAARHSVESRAPILL